MFDRHGEVLLKLFRKIHELKGNPENAALCLAIQEELITRISRLEARTRILKGTWKLKKKELSRRHTDRQRARRLKGKLAALSNQIDETKILISILRDVGEGLVFIYIDRWEIKPFTFKSDSGFLSGKKGARLERAVLRQVFEKGGIGILNDLTHSLRHGDVTVISNSGFFLIECKSGRGGSFERLQRQLESANEIMTYLKTDATEGLYEEGLRMHRIETHAALRSNLEAINDMLRGLNQNCVVRQVEPGLHYAIVGSDGVSQLENKFKSDMSAPLICFVNDLKHKQAGFVPFVLSIDDPLQLLSFYRGEFIIMVIVEFDRLVEVFASHNLEIVYSDVKDCVWQIRDAVTKEECLRVMNYFVSRMFAEFISLQWFIDEVIYRAKLPKELFQTAQSNPNLDSENRK